MASDFLKGLGIGVVEGVAESLDEASKKFKEVTGKTIDYHLQQGQAEKLRHKKQQRETEDVLQRLASITGESDQAKAFNQAGEILSSLGGDLTEATKIAAQISKARSIDPTFDVKQALTFSNNKNVPLQSRADIIKSFATGSRGMYTADVAPVKPEGLLGAIVGEKDVGARVERQLKAIGIQPEDTATAFTRPASATIDYTMIDPEGTTKFKQAQETLKATKVSIDEARQRIELNKGALKKHDLELETLPQLLRDKVTESGYRIAGLKTSNEIKEIELKNTREFSYMEYKLKNDQARANLIRTKAGTDIEAFQAFLITEEQMLLGHIEDLRQQGVPIAIIEEQEAKLKYNGITKGRINALAGAGTEFTSKTSAVNTLSAALADYAEQNMGGKYTQKKLGDEIRTTLGGNATESYNGYMFVNRQFEKQYKDDPIAMAYLETVKYNPVKALNNEIRKQVNNNFANITLANTIANKADYEINRVYNLSGMEKLLKDKNDKGFFLDSKTNKKGVTSYDYPYAIWTGDRFVPIQPLPNQN